MSNRKLENSPTDCVLLESLEENVFTKAMRTALMRMGQASVKLISACGLSTEISVRRCITQISGSNDGNALWNIRGQVVAFNCLNQGGYS